MMRGRAARLQPAAAILLCAIVLGASGCNRQQKTDTGKTYTSDQKAPGAGGGGGGAAGGGSGSSGGSQTGAGQSEAKPLDAPADTTNGKPSKASDLGTTDATRGQVVAEPGAPVEHEAKPAKASGHS